MMSGAEEVKPDLPEGWAWTNLEDCVEILDCQRIPINAKDRETRKGEIPYYGATGQTGWIDDYLFDEELVLLGEDGAPFLDPLKNKSYIISGKSWVNNHAHVLKAIDGLAINHFILHYLNIFHYEDYVSGTTRLKLNQAPMKKIPIPLAPLPEQRRIVARIEELFSHLDAGVEALQRAKAQLRRYRQAVLKAAVEGRLTEEWRKANPEVEPAENLLERISIEKHNKIKIEEKIKSIKEVLSELPRTWAWTNLEMLKDFSLYGPRFSSDDYSTEGYAVLRTSDISDSGKVDIKTAPLIPLDRDDFLKYKVEKGDLLITRTGSLGTLAVFDDEVDAIPGAYLIQYRLMAPQETSWYIFYFLKSPNGQKKLLAGGAGVGRPNLNAPTIEAVPIPLPPLNEQREICQKIETLLSIAYNFQSEIESSLKQADRLRQSILRHAFEGKLVPQDISDEPASILLFRILEAKGQRKEKFKPSKPASRKETTMLRIRLSLNEVLTEAKTQLMPHELFHKAGFSKENIDEFYQELRYEINRLRIMEIRPNEVDVYLKVVENENK